MVNHLRNIILPSILDYTGEFGPELVLCVPFCNWLSQMGITKSKSLRIYKGMRCFYEDFGFEEITEKEDQRKFVSPGQRAAWLPVKNEHDFDGGGQSPLHRYPDYRTKFRAFPLLADRIGSDRKLLVIHNKFADEWASGPINHISLEALNNIFTKLSREYQIVYIRHGLEPSARGFTDDHNTSLSFDDLALVRSHPNVLLFGDLYKSHTKNGGVRDLNGFKNALYAKCYHYITCQGGGSHQIAMFSGSLISILHRRGSEERWAYGEGYYSFMAKRPPICAVATDEEELATSLGLFEQTAVWNDQVLLPSGSERTLDTLSPFTIGARRDNRVRLR